MTPDHPALSTLARLRAELDRLEGQMEQAAGKPEAHALHAAILQAQDGIALVEAMMQRMSQPPSAFGT